MRVIQGFDDETETWLPCGTLELDEETPKVHLNLSHALPYLLTGSTVVCRFILRLEPLEDAFERVMREETDTDEEAT